MPLSSNSGPARSLNSAISWDVIVAIFKLESKTKAFPYRTVCPFCKKNRLYVFEDRIQRGHFHYCACGCSSGDMIELAAKLWKLPVRATIMKLSDAGYISAKRLEHVRAVDRYEERHLNRRNDINAVWEQARLDLFDKRTPTLECLMQQFCLHSSVSQARWLVGPGQVVGATTAFEVEKALWPKSAHPTRSARGGHTTNGKAIFVGDPWNEILLLPHHDMPGRICGLTCVGRQGRPEDIIFAPIEGIRVFSVNVRDGGLVGLGALTYEGTFTKNVVVAINDPLLVARAQVRHVRMSLAPLPLLACREDRHVPTVTVWRCLDTRRLVHWGWHMTPALLYRAIITDSDLSLAGPESRDDGSIANYLRRTSPGDMVNAAIKTAHHWPEALKNWAETQLDSAVEAIFLGLREYKLDVDYIIRSQIPKELYRRIMLVLGFQPLERAVPIDQKHVVIERNNCWYLRQENGTVIPLTDFVIRTDVCYSVLGADGEDHSRIRGRILSGSNVIPFDLPANAHNHHSGPFAMLCRLCKRTVHVLPRFLNRIWAISALFQEPAYEDGVRLPGE